MGIRLDQVGHTALGRTVVNVDGYLAALREVQAADDPLAALERYVQSLTTPERVGLLRFAGWPQAELYGDAYFALGSPLFDQLADSLGFGEPW